MPCERGDQVCIGHCDESEARRFRGGSGFKRAGTGMLGDEKKCGKSHGGTGQHQDSDSDDDHVSGDCADRGDAGSLKYDIGNVVLVKIPVCRYFYISRFQKKFQNNKKGGGKDGYVKAVL